MHTDNYADDADLVDALSFFKEEIAPRHFPYFLENPLSQKFGWRIAGFGAWRAGKATLGGAVRNVLPARYKSEGVQRAVHEHIDEKLDGIFRSRKLYERGAVSLFGKPFSPVESSFQGWLALFKTLAEAVVADQYHARRFIKKDSIVMDGGAFIGAFSVFAAALAPKGRVYSFEPASSTYATLQKKCRCLPEHNRGSRCLG